jgi:hypothetical protein
LNSLIVLEFLVAYNCPDTRNRPVTRLVLTSLNMPSSFADRVRTSINLGFEAAVPAVDQPAAILPRILAHFGCFMGKLPQSPAISMD